MIKVSVVMPVYNGGRTLRQALDSILNQTMSHFEVIVVDDGSTDDTLKILNSYDDERIVQICNPRNLGLTGSLNRGLAVARGEFVARMDGDDISLPERFSEQIDFFTNRPEVGILGSAYTIIDKKRGVSKYHGMPRSDIEIRWMSFLENPFAHPTVMIRQNVLAKNGLNYNEMFKTAQDYDLWCRLLKYTRGANLEKSLVQYGLSDGLTQKHRASQLKNHDVISMQTIRKRLPDVQISQEDVGRLRELFVMCNERVPGVWGRKVILGQLYINLFESFISQYEESEEVKELKRVVAVKVAQMVLHRPLDPGWMGLFSRLMRFSASVPFSHLAGWSKRRKKAVDRSK